jgi:cytosine/adenosine deaminase-related metal-dependent hydrolase
MKIIQADYTYIDGEYKKGYGVAFEEKIELVAPIDEVLQSYPSATIIESRPHSVLYPGFINTHVHLEFSTNSSTLKYGSFLPWLYSVIEHRDELLNSCDESMVANACDEMLRSGVTAFGAISSLGLELETCIKAPQRVVFFNELIGSNPQTVDTLYQDFLERFNSSSMHSKALITPAIAIHSPYSVHPIVVKKALVLAKEHNCIVSAHLLESSAEREWLDSGEGEFGDFFKTFLGQSRPTTTVDEFISVFDGYPTHFTHCVQANESELQRLSNSGHTIAHCPRSNRLLGCGRLEIERLIALNLPFSVATDGLSSNSSLNIFDELRGALMLHHLGDIHKLSKLLIRSITSIPAKILGLNVGSIEEGREADFALITLPQEPIQEEDIALWSILHTQQVSQLYIKGERYV